MALREALRRRALAEGFALAGFTTAEPLRPAAERRWRRWLAEGRAGVMAPWLGRPAPRRTHPRDLLPEARTALVVAAGYYQGDHECPPEPVPPGRPDAKIARYAWGEDYHVAIRRRLEALGEWFAGEYLSAAGPQRADAPPVWRACVDSAPLDERALAARAGLGFIGKNTLLIHPARGSWSLLGVLLLSVELPPDEPLRGPAAHCGSCRRCLEACPTGALDAPWMLDPRRCISYLTIELRERAGDAPDAAAGDEVTGTHGWAFGCDICQEVCPYNQAAQLGVSLPELARERGAGPWLSEPWLRAIGSGKALARRWGHTALTRPGLKSLWRNLRWAGYRATR